MQAGFVMGLLAKVGIRERPRRPIIEISSEEELTEIKTMTEVHEGGWGKDCERSEKRILVVKTEKISL